MSERHYLFNSLKKSKLEFDLCENFETLEEVRIQFDDINLSVINSLKCLSNLKTLSLYHCKFNPLEARSCLKELSSLRGLRYFFISFIDNLEFNTSHLEVVYIKKNHCKFNRKLHMRYMKLSFDEPGILYDTLKNLTDLENVDLSQSFCNR